MKRVEIDPKLLEEEVPKNEQKRVPQPVVLEKEKPSVENILTKEAPSPLLTKPEATRLDQLQNISPPVGELTGKEGAIVLPKARDAEITIPEPEGLKDLPAIKGAPNQQALQSGKEGTLAGGGNQGEGVKFSNLDQLLAGNATVSSQTAPILMPTDLLFEYDADTLKPAAEESLTKLGALIEKNAQAIFRIEGHTDSYGSDEYNMNLSLRRAEAVKAWLQQRMGIDAARITTSGLGKSRLLVPATGSVQEQQLNRRVEIVISTH